MMRHRVLVLVSLLLLLVLGFTSVAGAAGIEGTGRVYLRWRGDYVVNGEAGHWTLEVIRLALTPRSYLH